MRPGNRRTDSHQTRCLVRLPQLLLRSIGSISVSPVHPIIRCTMSEGLRILIVSTARRTLSNIAIPELSMNSSARDRDEMMGFIADELVERHTERLGVRYVDLPQELDDRRARRIVRPLDTPRASPAPST